MAQKSILPTGQICLLALKVPCSDRKLTTDFFIPEGTDMSTIDGNYFAFTAFQNGASLAANATFVPNKAFGAFFTGLELSYAFFNFVPEGISPPHTAPRGTGVLYVLQGTLSLSLIDTTKKLYNQFLQAGDLFVSPEDHVQYQINDDPAQAEVKALTAFSNSNSGLQAIPNSVFGSGINDNFFAKAFDVTKDTVRGLEAPNI